jgi:glycine dehydrogenase subunit 1
MRFLPHTEQDRADMLARIGVGSIDDLFADIPPAKRLKRPLDLPKQKSELEVSRLMRGLAAKNHAAGDGPFFVGAGAYRHHVPAAVDHIIQRSEFLTSYTPYQPEIAQGTLQYLFEFQTQVANLTGMEVANASMYDGSTATAEAVLMAHRVTRRKKAVLSGGLHPHYRETVETVSRMAGDSLVALDPDPRGTEDILAAIDGETSCVVVQSPSFYGYLIDLAPIAEKAHAAGALLVAVFTEVVSLGLLEPPGAQGADIVAGEGQSIGNALNFGGPYVGLFATRQKYLRQMPGRLSGMTLDAEGERGFVLTLSTREQHIRREKATSNICTNSGLCSLAFTTHMTLLGETGLTALAEANHARACQLADALGQVPGVEVLNEAFFNEFAVKLPRPAAPVVEALAKQGIMAGVPASRLEPDRPDLANLLIVAATETTTDEHIATFAKALSEAFR